MYVSLDDFIDYEKLNDLNNYLNQINIYNFNCVNFVANNKISSGELNIYIQENVLKQTSGSQKPDLVGTFDKILIDFN